MDIYFAGGTFRAKSKFANIAKISSTRKIRVIQYSILERTINVWNKLSTDCVHATSVNVFKNRIDKYLVKASYT